MLHITDIRRGEQIFALRAKVYNCFREKKSEKEFSIETYIVVKQFLETKRYVYKELNCSFN